MIAGAVAAVTLASGPVAVTSAAPADAVIVPDGSRLISYTHGEGREVDVEVYSAAMDRNIPLKLLVPPGDTPRPTVYVLDGVGGAHPQNGLMTWGDAANFYKDKDVNVVATVGGDSSYFADWQRDDPELGRNKWATFLTKELPPVIDSTLNTTGKNAIVGVSMSATSVLGLAIAEPDLYDAVAAFSGCAQTSDPMGRAFVEITVSDYGGNATNMWGPPGDPAWEANDPYLHAEGLRGTALYLSNSSGLPGKHDHIAARNVKGQTSQLIVQMTVGGVIEAATNQCTRNMQRKLNALGIPATYNFREGGTHSWDYWRDDVHESWPVLEKAIS